MIVKFELGEEMRNDAINMSRTRDKERIRDMLILCPVLVTC